MFKSLRIINSRYWFTVQIFFNLSFANSLFTDNLAYRWECMLQQRWWNALDSISIVFIAPYNNMRTLKFKVQPNKCVFRYRQSNVRWLLSASDYRRARGNQIDERYSDNGTVLGSSRKLGGASEHLIDGSEKRICRLSFFKFWSPHVIESRSNLQTEILIFFFWKARLCKAGLLGFE